VNTRWISSSAASKSQWSGPEGSRRECFFAQHKHLKYVIQLAFTQVDCASSTAECEGLLAGLRIAAGLAISHLAIRGDSQLTVGQAEGVRMSPLMKAYVDEVQKLECHFCSLKLEHVPRGQVVAVKELSRIAPKGLPVPT
jgi:ribonuclease HI